MNKFEKYILEIKVATDYEHEALMTTFLFAEFYAKIAQKPEIARLAKGLMSRLEQFGSVYSTGDNSNE